MPEKEISGENKEKFDSLLQSKLHKGEARAVPIFNREEPGLEILGSTSRNVLDVYLVAGEPVVVFAELIYDRPIEEDAETIVFGEKFGQELESAGIIPTEAEVGKS